MKKHRLLVFILAALFVVSAGTFLFTGNAQPKGGMPPMPDIMPPMGMMGSGGSSMVFGDSSLYVMSGRMIYKIDTSTMRVAGEMMLPSTKPGK